VRHRDAVGAIGFTERRQDDRTGDAAMRRDSERVEEVIDEPADDLDVSVIGQPPVGEVGTASARWVARRQTACRRLWAVSVVPGWCSQRGLNAD
jgi:hypothetical protein